MLAFVLRHPPCAARVIRLEVSRGGPVWSLWSKRHDAARVERTLFVAATGRALREALEDLPRAAFAALPGRVLFEIAERARAVGGQVDHPSRRDRASEVDRATAASQSRAAA